MPLSLVLCNRPQNHDSFTLSSITNTSPAKKLEKRKTVYFIKNYVLHKLMQTVAEQQIQGHLCSPCNFYITSSAKNAIDI
jgi:hypothetical protein